jgi:hypothetical protein
MFSNTWQHARFDIDNIADVIDVKNGGIFLPWEANRPDHGRITCFPIHLPSLHLVKKFYLSSFNTGLAAVGFSRFDPKNLRQFQESFPIFGPDDVRNYLDWHERVVLHGLTFSVFIPPAHTLRDGQPLSTWFDDLPPNVQSDVMYHFSYILTGCIRSKTHSSLRHEYPDIYDSIQGNKADGYLTLYDLALHAGNHPLLCHYGASFTEPQQSNDTTLSVYLSDWLQYSQQLILDGLINSDRYFHQQFLHNMHPTVRTRLGPYLHQTIAMVPLSLPLPPSLAPDRLRSHLIQHVRHLQIRNLLSKTPRQLSSPPPSASAVRSLQHFAPSDPDAFNAIMIAALRTLGPCILCRATDHKFAVCPSLENLKSDPYMCAMLLRTLQRMTPTGPTSGHNRAGTTPRPGRPQVRQLTNSVSAHTTESSELLPILEAGEGDPSTFDSSHPPMSEPGEGIDSSAPDFC